MWKHFYFSLHLPIDWPLLSFIVMKLMSSQWPFFFFFSPPIDKAVLRGQTGWIIAWTMTLFLTDPCCFKVCFHENVDKFNLKCSVFMQLLDVTCFKFLFWYELSCIFNHKRDWVWSNIVQVNHWTIFNPHSIQMSPACHQVNRPSASFDFPTFNKLDKSFCCSGISWIYERKQI